MGKKGNEIRHLLVIRLSAMGDVAMLVPSILALAKSSPALRITLLTRKRFEPIFEEIPNVSIFSAELKKEHKGVIGLYRLYKQLSNLQIDAIADTHNVLRSTILKFFFKFSGTPFVQIDKGRKEKKALTRFSNKAFKPLKTTHQRYTDVFNKLDFNIRLSPKNILPKVQLPEHYQTSLNISDKLIGIAPFAAYESKMYPLELMEKVVQKLSDYEECKILLFGGGQKEEKVLNRIAQKFGEDVINIAGKLSFKEELAVISNLSVMLAMDSGNGHLAANYGVSVITLWGATHPYAGFAPFGQPLENSLCADREKYPLIPTSVYGNKFPKGYDKAMESIIPDNICSMVIAKLQEY